ncbi:hypothetical protein O1L60_36340 [Streptomyces diastatochromogenes]|nr:hypothetical protein [Streptomyces diastatochromogenes]
MTEATAGPPDSAPPPAPRLVTGTVTDGGRPPRASWSRSPPGGCGPRAGSARPGRTATAATGWSTSRRPGPPAWW